MIVAWVGVAVIFTAGVILVVLGLTAPRRRRAQVHRKRLPGRSTVVDGYTHPSEGVARVCRGEERIRP